MVASSQPLATSAGLAILSAGGNAADAAVATAAALSVTEPVSTGLGGDMFALYYEAKNGQVTALNGSGRAPACLTLDLVRETTGATDETPLPPDHPYNVTVPGACAGWCDLIERHGSLSLSTLLDPAIHLAEEGFPVGPVTSHSWQAGADRLLKDSLNGFELTIEGRAPKAGEIFHNPGMARTLKEIAGGGKEAFYRGRIGEAIAATLKQAGGCLTLDDLSSHTSTWDEPVSITYGGLRLWECPPNGQGITALLALNILEGFDLPVDPLSAERLHLEIEALRLAFADTGWYIADPSHVETSKALRTSEVYPALISKEYAAERRKLIDPKKATLDQQRGAPAGSSDTVYFCVVDDRGNACSFINSNYMGFGTGIVPHGWGFTLQNRGHNFSLKSGHPNALAPGKRPYHTIIPALITRQMDGSLIGPMGVMGGFMQPQGHVQVFLALAQGFDPQPALELPRFRIAGGNSAGEVALEEGIAAETVKDLAERGHKVRVVRGWGREIFGRGQVILRNADSGVLTGGSDPRGDGCAMGLN